jgi:hypothetical protein
MAECFELATLTDHELSKLDIAEVNLACAAGLPDAGEIDVRRCSQRLDFWATKVRKFTEDYLRHRPARVIGEEETEEYVRILCLITVLQRDLGVQYNPAKVDPGNPPSTPDVFLHGAIFGDGGTCASLPILYTAVGRRLGYPLKLVEAVAGDYGHLFVRWDDPIGERFNIEGTNRGLTTPPDDYYRTGIYSVSPDLERKGCLLRSLTPRQELSGFLAQRAFLWERAGNLRQAVKAWTWAYGLYPEKFLTWNSLVRLVNGWHERLEARKPPRFPLIEFENHRRFPEALPVPMKVNILGLEVIENMLNNPEQNERWWEPLRKGLTPVNLPARCKARFTDAGCDLSISLVRNAS